MKNRYRNLWANETLIKRPEFYENDAPMIHEYRGVQVFKRYENGYDFVLNGACITQRAGATDYKRAINDILEGRHYCSDKVAAHINANGGNALPYPA